MNFFKLSGKDIGIDLGTGTTLVTVKSEGIVKCEPSVIAIDKKTKEVIAIGVEAKEMLGKTPEGIQAIRPLKNGVIADLTATELMLAEIIGELRRTKFIGKPRVVIGIPSGVTEVERRAVEEAVYDAGARQVFLIDEPLASAIGANLNISEPSGNLVVDLGAGVTEVAVISLGGIVLSSSTYTAGDNLDQNILEYVRKNEKLEIGEVIAEKIKMEIGNVKPGPIEKMEIKGRDLQTGLPRTIVIDSYQVEEAIRKSIEDIINTIKITIEKTPPELVADITQKGITLCGGGALLKGLDELIQERIGIPVYIATNPLNCMVNGTERTLENTVKIKELQSKKRP